MPLSSLSRLYFDIQSPWNKCICRLTVYFLHIIPRIFDLAHCARNTAEVDAAVAAGRILQLISETSKAKVRQEHCTRSFVCTVSWDELDLLLDRSFITSSIVLLPAFTCYVCLSFLTEDSNYSY